MASRGQPCLDRVLGGESESRTDRNQHADRAVPVTIVPVDFSIGVKQVKVVNVMIGMMAVVGLTGSKNPLAPAPTSALVTYVVTGTASRASMTYATADSGTAQQGARGLPWQHSWVADMGEFAYLSAQNDGSSGCVTVEIKLDNAPWKSTQSCGAYVIASVSGSVE